MTRRQDPPKPPPVPLPEGWHVIEVTEGNKQWYEVRKGGGSWLVLVRDGAAMEFRSLCRARRARDKRNREDAAREAMTERRVR